MSEALNGKVAVVTGASGLIGKAIATRLAGDGAAVLLHYGANAEPARALAERILADGGRAATFAANLASPRVGQEFWQSADDAYRAAGWGERATVDILVHNAGRSFEADLGATTVEQFDEMFAINARAPFFITQGALDRLVDGGRIVTVVSLAALTAQPAYAAYGASKAPQLPLVKTLAAELGPRGITVNNVHPGYVPDAGTAAYINADAAVLEGATARTALKRLGTPEDLADTIAFLASDQSRWITGQDLNVSGGLQ